MVKFLATLLGFWQHFHFLHASACEGNGARGFLLYHQIDHCSVRRVKYLPQWVMELSLTYEEFLTFLPLPSGW